MRTLVATLILAVFILASGAGHAQEAPRSPAPTVASYPGFKLDAPTTISKSADGGTVETSNLTLPTQKSAFGDPYVFNMHVKLVRTISPSGNLTKAAITQTSSDADAKNPAQFYEKTVKTEEFVFDLAGNFTITTNDFVTWHDGRTDSTDSTDSYDAANKQLSGTWMRTKRDGDEKTVEKRKWNPETKTYEEIAMTTPLANPLLAGGLLGIGALIAGSGRTGSDLTLSPGGFCSVGQICFTPSSLQFSAPNQTMNFSVSTLATPGRSVEISRVHQEDRVRRRRFQESERAGILASCRSQRPAQIRAR